MKKRISKNMFLLVFVVLVISVLGTLTIYYRYMTREVEHQLVQESETIIDAINMLDADDDVFNYLNLIDMGGSLRLTMISPDGSVIYDNKNDAEQMENHSGRPEVLAALNGGSGQIYRHSDTLGKQTFYQAMLTNDGRVLRLAYTTDNMWWMILSILPWIMICLLLCLVIGFIMADRMTKTIIKPINNLDLQHPKKNFVYDELKPLLIRINRQNDERNRNEKLRQEFSANVSHELKTPLTSISGYAELIMNGVASPEDVPKFANKIYKEANRMEHLVEDIIKVSRLEEHRIGIERENVDILKIAIDVKERLEIIAGKHKILIQVNGQPTMVMAVGQMMDEMLYNLCENAIKYNRPGGKVMITVAKENNHGRIEIEDTGIGIPEKYQGRVFERFFRVDKSHSRQNGGTGLGLAIVKHIVEYHNGEIHLSSALGKGTKIIVII